MSSPISDLPSSPEENELSIDSPYQAYLSSQNGKTGISNGVVGNGNGNGRVYEIAQGGKLKLKINLKGLDGIKTNKDATTDNSLMTTPTNSQIQSQIDAPVSVQNNIIPHTTPQQAVSDEPLDIEGYSSDVFSDDLDLDDLFKNEVINRKLSESISTFITHAAFNVTIRLPPGYSISGSPRRLPTGMGHILNPPDSGEFESTPTKSKRIPKSPMKARVKKRSKVPHSRFIHKMPLSESTKSVESDDDEILERSVKLSLKDPVSGSRLVTPLRSKYCSHLECFDYDSFLAMYNLKPFKIGLKRFSAPSANVGDVDVMKLFEDTKKPLLKGVDHNKNTVNFQIKTKQKQLKEKGKQLNELEWFCCPICNLEFNIKQFGDVYVVGEFVDLLLDLLHEPNQEKIDSIEIDIHEKTFKWISSETTEEKRKVETTTEVINLSDEDDDDYDSYNQLLPPPSHPPPTMTTVEAQLKQEYAHAQAQAQNQQLPIHLPSESVSPMRVYSQSMDPQTEREMFKQIDALFEAEGIATNSFVPQVNKPSGGRLAGVVGFRPGAFVEPEPGRESEPVFMSGEGGADDPIVLD